MLILALLVAVAAALRGLWSPCGLSMLSSLNPVAERGRGHRPWLTGLWYIAGAMAGGSLLGAACAAAAWAMGALRLSGGAAYGVAAAAALVGVASDARWRWSLPDHPRQVDETWMRRFRRWIYAAGYGIQIGSGFATYIMTAGVYLTAVLAVLAGPAQAVLVGVVFGLTRGLTILVPAAATTPERLRALLRRVDALEPASRTMAVVVQAGAAIAAAVLAAGPIAGAAVAASCAVPVAAARLRAAERATPGRATPRSAVRGRRETVGA